MSADQSNECPRCIKRYQDKRAENLDAARRAVDEGYGVVLAEEYLDLVADLEKVKASEFDKEITFYEYCEFYMDDTGEFTADYKGKCTRCHFEFDFHHKEKAGLS